MDQTNKELKFLSEINHIASIIGIALCTYALFNTSILFKKIFIIFLLILNILAAFLWLSEMRYHEHKKYNQIVRLYTEIFKLSKSKLISTISTILMMILALFIKAILPLLFI